jgi:5-methylcytosine-specific restriction endonuclease McrA
MNRWKIPAWLEKEVIDRDRLCVYCSTPFAPASGARRSQASWEHIVNDANIITRDNIALCCIGCNASKGTKDLAAWLDSKYCERRSITRHTVAPIIRAVLDSNNGT